MGRTPEEESTRVTTTPSSGPDELVLLVLSGPARGRFFRIPKAGGVIGRDPGLAVSIDEAGISREHARISRNDLGYFQVEDNDSRFGTFVEGAAVDRHVLMDGDRVQVSAETVMRVRAHKSRDAELDLPSLKDELTGLHHAHYFAQRLEQEYAFARRHRAPIALLLVDIDWFQRINADKGRSTGDRALRATARVLANTVRTEDILARLGGDEFIVLIRGYDGDSARRFGVRLVELFRARPLQLGGDALHLTVSVGVAPYDGSESAAVLQLMARAEAALFEAKRQGRNRVALWSPE